MFKTLGWIIEHVRKDNKTQIMVSQSDYIESQLEMPDIKQEGMHQEKTPLTDVNKAKMRKIIGQLRWLTDQSRPDGPTMN